MKKPFKNIVRDRRFYRTFFSLTLIIALQQLVAFAVNLADNMMLGRFSEYAMSGASIVNQVQFLLQSIIFGISNGAVVLGSQYWGKQEIDPIKKITGIAVRLSLIVGIIFFILGRFFPEKVLFLLTNDPDVLAEGVKYMRAMSYTYIIYAVSNALVMSMRAAEIAAIGTIMSCITLVINTCLNYVLIFGNFGAPRLGIVGAAAATTVSRIVELVVIFIYALCIDKKLRLTLRDLFSLNSSYFRDYASVALPSVAA
ncbi:MAG: polysaccharide biosynthesis C-terminal domain-containing protein, partial [Oscillospiraceae bacterium]|nr:polysaccharide biosynthesis C-terminal domain-containing protein [Oscillospiraceae bacterium]